MKNRLRDFTLLFVLLLLVLLAGCSEDGQQSPDLETMLPADRTSMIVELFAEPDRFDRLEKLISALRAVPADQLDVFRDALSNLKDPHRQLERILVITAWAKYDAPAATKWAIRRERVENVRNAMFAEAVYLWALQDPEAIVRDTTIAVYSQNMWDAHMIRALVKGWYESGQPHLETFIHDLGKAGDDRQRAVSQLIVEKTKREGSDAVIEWATQVKGDLAYRRYVHSRVAGQIAKVDPQRAVAWCEQICDTELGRDFAQWIGSEWVVHSGADAMNWLASRPETIYAKVANRAAYRHFLLSSITEAYDWAESLTEEQRNGSLLQGVIIQYANARSASRYPETTIEWSRYIIDESERERVLVKNARRWLRHDPSAAEAWLAETSLLSEEAMIKVRASRQKTRRIQG